MTMATQESAPRVNGHDGTLEVSSGLYPHLIHSAPSQTDLLALKRQRIKSLQSICCPEASGSQQSDESDSQTTFGQQDDDTPNGRHDRSRFSAPQEADFLLEPSFTAPVLAATFGEPMSGFFQRLRAAHDPSFGGVSPRAVSSTQEDGVYVHKRPIRGPNGSSPLAVCGSVLHHVVVYIKEGSLLHSLDYGPANGADVTANILEEAPAKTVLATSAVPYIASATATDEAEASIAPVLGEAAVPTADELPYLYLGPASRGVEDQLVQKVIAFAESRPYHALRNNCIHFADTLVRVVTGGAVRNAPLLYDMLCGSVPPMDNPMLLMMQLMLRMTWFMVVDGSTLAAAFAEHHRAVAGDGGSFSQALQAAPSSSEQQQQQQRGAEQRQVTDGTSTLQTAAPVEAEGARLTATEAAAAAGAAASEREERENNAGAAAAVAVVTPGEKVLRVGDSGEGGDAPDEEDGKQLQGLRGATQQQQQQDQGQEHDQLQRKQEQDEERRQELDNDHAAMDAGAPAQAKVQATHCKPALAVAGASTSGDVEMADINACQ